VLCASPDYVARKGMPANGAEITDGRQECLNLRYPGAAEFQWTLETPDGPRRHAVRGRYECDDGDVLTGWALAGLGIVLKPVFEVAEHLAVGTLVPVATENPPLPVQMACLYTHRRHQDPKARLFMEFMIPQIVEALRAGQLPR
jgi:DNA-binding transcriptional LysR family regulator